VLLVTETPLDNDFLDFDQEGNFWDLFGLRSTQNDSKLLVILLDPYGRIASQADQLDTIPLEKCAVAREVETVLVIPENRTPTLSMENESWILHQ
jgi:hypothetical protein